MLYEAFNTCPPQESDAKAQLNLLKHDRAFPSAEYLHKVTVTGNRGYGMSAVGQRGSAGANLIIRAVDRDDPRPLWLLAWGGANTIAQAIWTVQETRSPQELDDFIRKIRVYDLAGQDDAGAWMAKNFPLLFIIRNVLSYKGMSFRYSSNAWDHTRGGDETVVTREWVKENIQTGHGVLGTKYPDALHIWEGDTPTFFHLMPNGLNDPEQQWQGGWGGRFSREKQKNVNVVAQEYAGADCAKGCWVNEKPYLDYWLFADANDFWDLLFSSIDLVLKVTHASPFVLQSPEGDLPQIRLDLTWTFPLAYAEIISGNGREIRRKKVDLSATKALPGNNLPLLHLIFGPSLAAPQSRNPHRRIATPAVSLNRSHPNPTQILADNSAIYFRAAPKASGQDLLRIEAD